MSRGGIPVSMMTYMAFSRFLLELPLRNGGALKAECGHDEDFLCLFFFCAVVGISLFAPRAYM